MKRQQKVHQSLISSCALQLGRMMGLVGIVRSVAVQSAAEHGYEGLCLEQVLPHLLLHCHRN